MARTVSLNLTANVQGLVAGLRTAQRATTDFGRQTQRWTQTNEQHLNTLGGAAGKAGAVAAAGLALVGKAAMDWESSWAGVLKTVDATPAGLRELEGELRGLARTLPSTHTEIAAVAEAAGQLGVKAGDVAGFTKTMIDLGQSTNLSAEEGATSLARFSNVMGTSNKDVGRLGATLVGLGNNFATTESEIMGMSMRLAGAGKQIGLSEGETMGLAAAMSSVGIEAEAGGSAMSTTMKRIGKAVDEGGSSLDTFAKVSGMTATDFATKWKTDAAGGIEAFTVGLGRAGEGGESVNAILTELGITGIREADALLRLSSAGELMGDSMKQGASEYEAGIALIEEANKRYETAESKVKVAWNNIKDAAIDAGAIMLPVIVSIAEGVTGMAQAFNGIPKPIQAFVLGLTGIVAVGGLGLAALSKLAVGSSNVVAAFTAMAPAGGRARGVIGKLGKTAGIAAVAVGAFVIAASMLSEKSTKTTGEYADALVRVAKAGKDSGSVELDSLFGDWDKVAGRSVSSIEGIGEAIARISNPESGDGLNEWADGAFAWTGLAQSETTQVKTRLAELGSEMGALVSDGYTEQASATFKVLSKEFENNGKTAQDALDTMPGFSAALQKVANDAGESATEAELLEWALTGVAPAAVTAAQGLDDVGGAGAGAAGGLDAAEVSIRGVAMSAEDAETAVEDFYDMLVAVGAIALSERDALRGLEESFDAAAKAAKENGKTLDITTEKGRANQASLDGIASATLNAVEAQQEQGRSAGELAATMEKGRQAYVDQAIAMGTPRKEAEKLANSLNLIPDAVFMNFESNAEGVSARVSELYEWIKAAPDGKIQIDDNSPEVRATLEALGFVVKDLPNGQIEVSEKGASDTGKKIDGVASKKRDAKITASAITDAANDALNILARDRTSIISAITINRPGGTSTTTPGNVVRPGQNGAFATGGPVFGAGTETSDSIPALLSNNEHVWTAEEVRRAGGHSRVEGLRELAMRGGFGLASFATGGRVGWSQTQGRGATERAQAATQERRTAEQKLKAAERDAKAADRAATDASRRSADTKGGKGNEGAKASAKAESRRAADRKKAAAKRVAAAKKEVAAAKKLEDQAKATSKDATERTERLTEGTFDLQRDIKRGTIVEAFTSGNGMGMVDRMFDASNNKDLSKGQRSAMRSLAYKTEAELLKLEKRSETLAAAMDKATKSRDDLLAVKDGVASSLRGEFSLSGMLGETRQDLGATPLTAKGIGGRANAMARKIEIFAGRLNRLRKLGYGETIIQEVAGLGTEDGITVAGVLMNATKGERSTIVSAYKRLDTASGKAGQYVTESMYKGGLDAADGLVKGLEAKTKTVENAFYKLGKSGENAFRRSLDMHSPSRTLFKAGTDAGDGVVGGGLASIPKVEDAFSKMGYAAEGAFSPALSVPPSAEVARYAAQPAAPVVHFDYDQLAAAMANVQVQSNVRIGNAVIAQANVAGRKELRLPPTSPRG